MMGIFKPLFKKTPEYRFVKNGEWYRIQFKVGFMFFWEKWHYYSYSDFDPVIIVESRNRKYLEEEFLRFYKSKLRDFDYDGWEICD